MFYHDGKLQYEVKVDKPNPQFAKMLQQAIGGIEGEMKVCLQYLFQAFGARGPAKYRDMLLDTGTEEIAHIEMLATAVALNLDGATNEVKDEMAASDPFLEQIMGGANPRHILSSGMGALATDSCGVPFNGSWIIDTGNLAANMYANVTAESAGRTLAARLWKATDDKGMKDMLAFLLARDTMHQNQWLAVLEEIGGLEGNHPIPNSFPQSEENQNFNYNFITTHINGQSKAEGRWSSGKSIDGKGEFTLEKAKPLGKEPNLGVPHPAGFAQKEQMKDGKALFKTAVDKITPGHKG